jgi:hypothetical protein
MTIVRRATWCVLSLIWLASLSGESLRGAEPLKLPDVKPFDLGEGHPLGEGPSRENSGIVKSRNWPDLYWMQNDSGDEPRIYPVRRDGSVYSSEREPEHPGVLIGGAINVDWEDIAVDASGRVIVADFGNNRNDRRDLTLYFVPEPAPLAERTPYLKKVFIRYPEQQQYPAPEGDFNYDAEALFTLGNTVFLCTKHRSDTLTRCYRLDDVRDDEYATLVKVDEFDSLDQVVGADATADGKRLVLLTYESLWLFEVTDPAHPLSGPVSWLPYADHDEVEAVCFADDETLIVGDEALARLYDVPLAKFARVRE